MRIKIANSSSRTIVGSAFLLLALFGVGNVDGQEIETVKTKTESRKRLDQLVNCINESDEAIRKTILTDAFEDQSSIAKSQRLANVAGMRNQLPELSVDKVLRSTDHQIMAHCKAKNGSVIEVYIELSAKSPFKIKNIELDFVNTVVSKGEYDDVAELPESELGKEVANLIETVNNNDRPQSAQFIKNTTTFTGENAKEAVEKFGNLFVATGGLEFYSIRKYRVEKPDDPTVVIAKARTVDSWHAIVLKTTGERFSQIRFAPARAPKSATGVAKITVKDAVGLVNQYVKRLSENSSFSGSILIAKGDDILMQRAMGLASRRFNVENNIDTKFNLASMNKMFTGVAVCQLIEAGKLSPDETVDKFLSPQWLPEEIASKIELRHLLTHTSGIGDHLDDSTKEIVGGQFNELDDYRVLFAREKLNYFEPGTNYRYSNTGMFLLGVVIEKVSGQSYFDYVREHIYGPAKMNNSDSYPIDEPVSNLAIGYYQRNGMAINNMPTLYRGGPAGGGYSTTGDLLKFSRALTRNKLLNSTSTKLATTAKSKLNSPNYGFGFQVRDEDGTRVFGHSGGSEGISTRMDILPDNDFTIVVLSNMDEPAEKVARAIRQIIRRVKK